MQIVSEKHRNVECTLKSSSQTYFFALNGDCMQPLLELFMSFSYGVNGSQVITKPERSP